ncbi:MAG: hypothetical protein WCA80_02525 [Candidatus Aquilonibacter sp.]
MSFRNQLTCALLIIGLAACGGGGNQSSSSAEPSSSAGAMMSTSGAMNAASPGPMAAVPPGLNCGAVQPVWVNQRSHTYHEPSDPLYGRTRHGAYMCPSAAVAAGYHKASGKHHHGGMGGSMEGAQPSPAST